MQGTSVSPLRSLWGGLGVVYIYLCRLVGIGIYVCTYVYIYICDGDDSQDWVYYVLGIQLAQKVSSGKPLLPVGWLGYNIYIYLYRLVGIGMYVCIYLFIYLSIYVFMYLYIYISIYIFMYLYIYISIYLYMDGNNSWGWVYCFCLPSPRPPRGQIISWN